MICNEKQYKITKSWRDKFLASFNEAKSKTKKDKLARDAFYSQYEELAEEVTAYELMKSGHWDKVGIFCLNELPTVLINARIAQGITQDELAKKLKMKAQQIQRYEAEEYGSISFRNLIKIADILKIRIDDKAIFLIK